MKEEKLKKKLNLKIILLAAIIIIAIIIVIVSINNVEIKRLEEEWREKPTEIGDVCINMGYYSQLVKEFINRNQYLSKEKYEKIQELDREIEEQMRRIQDTKNSIRKAKAPSQEKYLKGYEQALELHVMQGKVNKELEDFQKTISMGGFARDKDVTDPCKELNIRVSVYIKSMMYSKTNPMTVERKAYFEK